MGQIQTGVGLISGLNISDIVDKLMAINAQPRDALTTRNTDLQNQQAANTELMALLYAVKYISDNLGKDDVFGSTSVTSSDSSVISVQSTGTPAVGDYLFIALQKAQSEQLISSGFESAGDALGAGKITFRFGNDVEHLLISMILTAGAVFPREKY